MGVVMATSSGNYLAHASSSAAAHNNSTEVSSFLVDQLINDTDDVGTDSAGDKGERSLAQSLWIFLGPFIFLMGIVGNILIFLVMRRRRLRSTSTSVYLRLMAVADLCVLLTGMIPEWLEACDVVTFKEISPVTCKLEKFSFYTCADTAIWILVVFTVDRFLALVFPLSVNEVCMPSRTKYNALLVLVLAVCKNFHVFWTRGPEYETVGNVTVITKMCGRPTPAYQYFEFFVRPWIAFTLVSALPFLILLICNICIINALIKVKRMRKTTSTASSSSDKTFYQMTIMCLSASFCFLVCITPSIVLLIGKPYWITDFSIEHPAYDIAKAINNQLVFFNHSVNFFLYCVTGRRFRMELMLMCRGKGGSATAQESESRLYRFTDRGVTRSPSGSQANIYAVNGNVKYSLVNQPSPGDTMGSKVPSSSKSSV